MSLKSALLEIGCEELPASYIQPAVSQMKNLVEAQLKDHRLSCQNIEMLYTPRRLSLYLVGLPEMQDDVVQEVLGPPVTVAFDVHGLPTRAGEGFARSQGVAVSSLKRMTTPKGEVVMAVRKMQGKLTSEILGLIFPEIIQKIRFPKVMRWGETNFQFARPIRWICAIFSKTIISFEIAGVWSSRETYGLRSLKNESSDVTNVDEYKGILKQNGVWVDPQERLNRIKDLLQTAAQQLEAQLIEDQALLDEVSNLVECPDVIVGKIDPRYLNLPSPVIITAMREHQKYFALSDKNQNLLPYFIGIINGRPLNKQFIIQMNENVLKARLEDALFFYEEDLKISINQWAKKANEITWLEKMGTVGDKCQRLQVLVTQLGHLLKLDSSKVIFLQEAAQLCKADLATNLIREKEFNTLQGIMGGIYARLQDKPQEIAQAIQEHYQPRFSEDLIPPSDLGAILSLADKLDTLFGCFKLGLVPTGSKDPLALRRQAFGIIKIILDREFPLSIQDILNLMQGKRNDGKYLYGKSISVKIQTMISEFILERFQTTVLEIYSRQYQLNISSDILQAALNNAETPLPKLFEKVEILTRNKPENWFIDITKAAVRISRILVSDGSKSHFKEELLKMPEEVELYRAVDNVQKKFAQLKNQYDYEAQLEILKDLLNPINNFFDKVLVMDKNKEIRNNRFGLLNQTLELFMKVCDFRKVSYF
jgi:glycyl-tRNA synthetase beta chain